MNAHSLHLYYVACVVLIKNRIKIEKKNILRRRLHLFFVAVLYLLFPILLFTMKNRVIMFIVELFTFKYR